MNIDLIRHGQSNGNVSDGTGIELPKGIPYDSLSPLGVEQSNSIVGILRKNYSEILCSPYNRTAQTILPYLKSSDQTARFTVELSEIQRFVGKPKDRRQWETIKATSIPEVTDNLRSFVSFQGTRARYKADQSQVMQQVCDSIALIKSYPNESNLLIVSHAHFLSKFLEVLLGADCWFDHKNCGMTRIKIEGEEVSMIFFNL